MLEGEKQKLFVFKVQGQSVHPEKQTALSGQFVNEGTSTARPRPQLFIQVGNTREKTPVGWEGGRGEGWGRRGRGGAGKQEQGVEAQKSKPWAAQLQRDLQEAQTVEVLPTDRMDRVYGGFHGLWLHAVCSQMGQ